MHIGASMSTAKDTNIFDMSDVTHSGHIFAPIELPTNSNDKGKAKEDVVECGKVGPVTNNKAPIERDIY